MKVELQNGDRITIPEGCKAIVNGNEVVVEKEEKEFKRGDVIVSKMNEILLVDVHSFENRILRSFVNIQQDGTLFNSSYSSWNEHYAWRLATEGEKQKLFAKMEEQGLQWNAAEKRIEKKKWRAPIGEQYFYLLDNFVVDSHIEANDKIDCGLYDFGNYFRTYEQAEKAVGVIKDALRRFFTEN